jgi:hypothetical protein
MGLKDWRARRAIIRKIGRLEYDQAFRMLRACVYGTKNADDAELQRLLAERALVTARNVDERSQALRWAEVYRAGRVVRTKINGHVVEIDGVSAQMIDDINEAGEQTWHE